MERSTAEVIPLVTVVQPYGEQEGTECGYCHSTTHERVAYGMVAKSCTCVDYQALCDAGWRRSGTYVYLPTNAKTCCPNITIRLDVTKFQASKDQHRIIRNLHRFLSGELDAPALGDSASAGREAASGGAPETLLPPQQSSEAEVNDALKSALIIAAQSVFPSLAPADLAGVTVTRLVHQSRVTAAVAAGSCSAQGVAPSILPALTHASNVAFVVCSAMNRSLGVSRPSKKPAAQETDPSVAAAPLGPDSAVSVPSPAAKPLRPADVAVTLAAASERLYSSAVPHSHADGASSGLVLFSAATTGHVNMAVVGGGVYRLSTATTMAPPDFVEFVSVTGGVKSSAGEGGSASSVGGPETHAQHKRARPSARGPMESSASLPSGPTQPAAAAHTWRVEMVPAAFDTEAFALYKKYQVAVHGDAPSEVTPEGYTRFLCESPLLREAVGALQGSSLLPRSPSAVGGAEGGAAPQSMERGAAALRSLVDMGFAEATAAAALARSRGDAAAALEALLGGGAGEDDAGGDWAAPAAQALRRCAEAVSAAWRSGEDGGAAIPLLAPATASPPRVTYPGFREGPEHTFPDLPSPAAAPAAAAAACAAAAASAPPSSVLSLGYGSFHQRYLLDGRLVAVGVVDVLPHCLSSVYLFYDPELGRRLQLGKLTALREIQWVQAAMAASPRLKYYYMGYYVHSCPKMRYKGEYAPSDLRCPVTGRWVPLAACAARLDADKHAALADEAPAAAAERRRRESAALAALLPVVPFILGGGGGGRGGGGDALLVLRELSKRGQGVLADILRELLPRLGGLGLEGGGLAARVVVYVR